MSRKVKSFKDFSAKIKKRGKVSRTPSHVFNSNRIEKITKQYIPRCTSLGGRIGNKCIREKTCASLTPGRALMCTSSAHTGEFKQRRRRLSVISRFCITQTTLRWWCFAVVSRTTTTILLYTQRHTHSHLTQEQVVNFELSRTRQYQLNGNLQQIPKKMVNTFELRKVLQSFLLALKQETTRFSDQNIFLVQCRHQEQRPSC